MEELDESDVSWVRQARDAESVTGRGVKALVMLGPEANAQLGSPIRSVSPQREERVLIGNRKLMAEEGITLPG